MGVNHHVCGRHELTADRIRFADRIISITSPGEPPVASIVTSGKPALFLKFDDLEDERAASPRMRHVREVLEFAASAAPDESYLVHCYAGISRSPAVMALLLLKRFGDDYDGLFSALREIRKEAWPNSRFIRLTDRVLKLRGAFVAAAEQHYNLQATLRPYLIPNSHPLSKSYDRFMRDQLRMREVSRPV